jgi:hypothetical protein
LLYLALFRLGWLLVRMFLAPLPAVINWTVAAARET